MDYFVVDYKLYSLILHFLHVTGEHHSREFQLERENYVRLHVIRQS